jgi:hypothetical protein
LLSTSTCDKMLGFKALQQCELVYSTRFWFMIWVHPVLKDWFQTS